ncbi:MAG: phospholipase D-like domain-containing protein [Bacteroidia bacterium]
MPIEPEHSTSGNQVEVFRGGKAFFSKLFERIDAAEKFIHIQVYILGHDQTGNQLLDHLFRAADRGVQVFLMLDAYGTSWVRKSHLSEWKKKGLHVKLFSRHFRFKRFFIGRRQHAKVVVIDSEWMSVGGLNFADRYNGVKGHPPWLDAACWVRGPAAAQLNRLAAVYWSGKDKQFLRNQHGIAGTDDGIRVWILSNDWLRKRQEIKKAYFDAIGSAKRDVLIVAAYFFPSRKLLRLLLDKAKAGVKVRLVFSAHSDVPLIKPSMEYFYSGLQREGIEIWEWKESVLHAKVAFVDQRWVTLGSYNLNQLSDVGGLEVNIAFEDEHVVGDLYSYFIEEIYPKTQLVKKSSGAIVRRFERFVAFLLIRLALKILFFTNRHPH